VKFTSRDFHTNDMRSGEETVLAMKNERWVVQHGILSAAHPTVEKKELGTITFRVDVEKLNNAAPLKVPPSFPALTTTIQTLPFLVLMPCMSENCKNKTSTKVELMHVMFFFFLCERTKEGG